MKLDYVTLTGADDAVDIGSLNDMAANYPFAELALLLLPEKMGTNRCPTLSWIEDFKANYEGRHKAMHLCGSAFLDFIKGNKDILSIMDGFKRIQLNLKFGDVEGKYDANEMIERIKATPDITFVIQYTADSAPLLEALYGTPNHALLFDGSAGQGIAPTEWPTPIEGHLCGYAGGINPENIASVLTDLQATVPDNYLTWIDMETGIRTDDHFDLSKARTVLEAASSYIS